MTQSIRTRPQRSVTRRVARAVGLILVVTAALHLGISLAVIVLETQTIREGLLTVGLRMMSVASRAEKLDSATLARALGDRPGFAVVIYDRQGKRLAQSRADVAAPAQLDLTQPAFAASAPDRAVFLEPYSLGRDSVGVMKVDAGEVGFVGIFDRWATRSVNRGVLLGTTAGLLVAAAVGLVATRVLTRRIQRELGIVEAVVSRIARGSWKERLPDLGNDEVGRLALSFNHMADQQEDRLLLLAREQEAKRRAFGDWSHEVATPLSSVLGYLESLRMGSVERSDTARYVQIAHEQALALKFLCDELSTLAQLESDGLTLASESFDLSELAQSETAAHEPAALQKGLILRSQLLPVTVSGDRNRLGQVLRNLLDNAIRHTASQKLVEVRTRIEHGEALLEVEDQGEGMSPADVARIGQRFFRADASRDRRTGGRGLGLAIANGIVLAHSGSLSFESTPGAGTLARVRLPLPEN